MEAIRLSLASEEERKRKAEKEERKEAKKREKEERKAMKLAARQGEPYGGGGGRSGQSSASASSLSLPSLGLGRKRGNSGASNLRVEASVASAMASNGPPGHSALDPSLKDKGKGIDRSLPTTPEATAIAAVDIAGSGSSSTSPTSAPRPIPSPHHLAGPSHLRQMSSASSISSSLLDSREGSYISPPHLQDPRSSGLSLGSRSGASEDGGDHDRDRDPSASTEPMFNFRSLAEVVGVTLEGEHAGRRLSQIEAEQRAEDAGVPNPQLPSPTAAGSGKTEDCDEVMEERVEDISFDNSNAAKENIPLSERQGGVSQAGQEEIEASDAERRSPPKVTITPETSVLLGEAGGDSKRLNYETTIEQPHQVTQ